jgi:hypothetical protein
LSSNQLNLSIFDQNVCIQTDAIDYLELIRKTYSHFLVDQPNIEGQVPFNVSFSLGRDKHTGRPRFIINGEEKQFEDRKLLQSEYVHSLILSSLYSQVSSHYLHHAAALSFEEKGIILTADSGYGKTTLTLALVQRGFRFLSDEIAALGRRDGLIYSFPRGLHIRKKTFNLLNLPVPVEKASLWFGKYLIDIDDIFPGMISKPASICYVFVLRNGSNPRSDSSISHEFKAIVSHTNPAFLQQIREHSEIMGVQVSEEEEFPRLIIQTAHRMKVIPFLEKLCSQQGIIILDLIIREDGIANFSPTTKYERISKSQAALELLRRFLGGYKTPLLNSNNYQDSTRLMFELASLLRNAECYQITVGQLNEMVNVITDLVCTKAINNTFGMKCQ